MQCVLEINTDVCETIGDAERDLRGKIGVVEAAADALGLRLWWGGTHPFSHVATISGSRPTTATCSWSNLLQEWPGGW